MAYYERTRESQIITVKRNWTWKGLSFILQMGARLLSRRPWPPWLHAWAVTLIDFHGFQGLIKVFNAKRQSRYVAFIILHQKFVPYVRLLLISNELVNSRAKEKAGKSHPPHIKKLVWPLRRVVERFGYCRHHVEANQRIELMAVSIQLVGLYLHRARTWVRMRVDLETCTSKRYIQCRDCWFFPSSATMTNKTVWQDWGDEHKDTA